MTLYFRCWLCVWFIFALACQNRLKDKIAQKDKAIDSLNQKLESVQAQKIKIVWEHAKAKHAFQGTILVASKGTILLKEAHGLANIQKNIRLSPESIFPIASLTQGFTAVAVLQLAERSKLRMNDKLTVYYPNFPYPEVEIIDLLRQTSGIPDYLTSFYTPKNQPLTHAYKQNVIDWLLQTAPKARFPAREAQAMSSTNYVFLADIVEKVSGVSIGQYWTENIWKPLEMTRTYLKEQKKSLPFLPATGYSKDFKELADESYVDFVYGDAGIHSTVEDLYKWEQALYSERILSQVAIKQFENTGLLKLKRPTRYTMAWFVENATQVQRGQWLGFKSYLARNPALNYTVIILNNNQNPYTHTLGEALQTVLRGENYKLTE